MHYVQQSTYRVYWTVIVRQKIHKPLVMTVGSMKEMLKLKVTQGINSLFPAGDRFSKYPHCIVHM